MRDLIVLSSVVAVLACGCASGPCPRPTKPDANVSQLLPGSYDIVFLATSGSERGTQTTGKLVLKRTSPTDRSPSTGEPPADFNNDRAKQPLYGWIDADLEKVGAPICAMEGEVLPNSHDPVFPGVIVEVERNDDTYPDGTPVLNIGTVSNDRTVVFATDGCGIGLWVHEIDPNGFSGKWGEYGIIANGRGRFCATRIE